MKSPLVLLLCATLPIWGEPVYEGYAEDRTALRDTYPLPDKQKASSDKAVKAAARLFKNTTFVSLTREEVVSILGDPKTISDYGIAASPGADSPLVYRFDTGWGGHQYTVHFQGNRVTKVTESDLD